MKTALKIIILIILIGSSTLGITNTLPQKRAEGIRRDRRSTVVPRTQWSDSQAALFTIFLLVDVASIVLLVKFFLQKRKSWETKEETIKHLPSSALTEALRDIYSKYAEDLLVFPWASEEERWAEFVTVLLEQCGGQDEQVSRLVVATLRDLNALDLQKLSAMHNSNNKEVVVFLSILKRYGFSDKQATQGVTTIIEAARIIQKQFEGKPQRYLRQHGERIRAELLSIFKELPLPEDQLHYAISKWIQNSVNLPISLENKTVREFCQVHDATIQELTAVADQLNLNIAVVDDLLELEKNNVEEYSEEEELNV